MTLLASAVASQNDHGYEAGRYVASHALAAFQNPPSLLIAAISDQYNSPDEVARGIRSIAGSVPLIGGSTAGVITMAGVLPKGVGVLALQSSGMQSRLALETGAQQQPALAAERALQRATSDLPTVQDGDQVAALLLAAGLAGGDAINQALQATSVQAGAVSTSAYVDDQMATDGVAVGVIGPAIPAGIGVDHSTNGAAAARQATAALGNHEVVAAIILMRGAPAEASGSAVAATAEQVRDVLGRTVPLVGMAGLGGIAAASDSPAAGQPTVLVYAIGQA